MEFGIPGYVSLFDFRTLVGVIVEGARCWDDEAEKPRCSSEAV